MHVGDTLVDPASGHSVTVVTKTADALTLKIDLNEPETPPRITTPTPGSTFTTTEVEFEWSAGSNVAEYWLGVGTTAESLSQPPWGDIYSKSAGTATRATVSGIPLDGGSVFARLRYKVGADWKLAPDVNTYKTADALAPAAPGELEIRTVSR